MYIIKWVELDKPSLVSEIISFDAMAFFVKKL